MSLLFLRGSDTNKAFSGPFQDGDVLWIVTRMQTDDKLFTLGWG